MGCDGCDEGYGYGYTAEEHAMRIAPWILRLQAGTDALLRALERLQHARWDATRAISRVLRALEDVSWWHGRLVGELAPLAADPRYAALVHQAGATLQRAGYAMHTARQALAQRGVKR